MSPDPENSIGAICVGDIKCYPIPDGDSILELPFVGEMPILQ